MLINRDAVTSFEPYFNRKIVLQLKTKLTDKAVVSRLKVARFKEWLER
jgi:two-component system response regulator LytT